MQLITKHGDNLPPRARSPKEPLGKFIEGAGEQHRICADVLDRGGCARSNGTKRGSNWFRPLSRLNWIGVPCGGMVMEVGIRGWGLLARMVAVQQEPREMNTHVSK